MTRPGPPAGPAGDHVHGQHSVGGAAAKSLQLAPKTSGRMLPGRRLNSQPGPGLVLLRGWRNTPFQLCSAVFLPETGLPEAVELLSSAELAEVYGGATVDTAAEKQQPPYAFNGDVGTDSAGVR